jgi:hypothetical protein
MAGVFQTGATLGGLGPAVAETIYLAAVGDDTWASLIDQFADEAYASVKGCVRTYVMHQQLLEHLANSAASFISWGERV